jgi:DNA topoisomerase-3
MRLLQKGSTVNLKDFKTDAGAVEGLLRFDENFQLKLEPKKTLAKAIPDELACPKCEKGTVLKGKTAYGCSDYKLGCDFKVTFDVVRLKLKDQKPTKELVYTILKQNI